MKEALRLSLTQKMQQRLSPQQMRFVRMLEMTGPEVEEEVRREIDDNPALERVDSSGDDGHDDSFGETAEEIQMADYKDEDDIPSYKFENQNGARPEKVYEHMNAADSPSLAESLVSQLSETNIDETDLAIAKYLIGNLDDNGYLTRSPESIIDDLAFNVGMDVDRSHFDDVLERVRALDPAGICAFDLRDCLSLQLRRLPSTPDRRLALEIVEDYFDIFSLKHFDRLQSLLSVSRERLQKAMDVIRSLNPKPGAGIGESEADSRARHIIPDFIVESEGDTLSLTLQNNIPELQIEQSFRADSPLLKQAATSLAAKEAVTFLNHKREDAQDFIDILRLRQDTLFRVMSAILKLQQDFFESEDESNLRPMILKDISRETGLDLSVISRAAAGKYVATAGGIYPLKFFFNEGVGDDDETSRREVVLALREIIKEEDKKKPFSDDVLTKMLAERGYEIARRTVAKYREREGIPVARLRREL